MPNINVITKSAIQLENMTHKNSDKPFTKHGKPDTPHEKDLNRWRVYLHLPYLSFKHQSFTTWPTTKFLYSIIIHYCFVVFLINWFNNDHLVIQKMKYVTII
jgi:hypothetical protein